MFGFFGSILGYLLWGLFVVFQNFGVSIILFTVILKFILFPFSVKQQKSMAKTSVLQKKQKELQKKYAQNREKLNEEMQKLYAKEGVSPTGGCLTSIVPFFIMIGIFYSVAYPLTNTLHIDSDTVKNAINSISTIPGYSLIEGLAGTSRSGIYQEINLIRILSETGSNITSFFTVADAEKIELFISGFNFAGFNLLTTPSTQGFLSIYILIPVLCLITNYASQFITMKISGNMQNQQGCMKYMLYILPLMTVWLSYSVPSAVGFYWICSSVFGIIQSIIMWKLYSPAKLTAKSEAQHVAMLEENEKNAQNFAP